MSNTFEDKNVVKSMSLKQCLILKMILVIWLEM